MLLTMSHWRAPAGMQESPPAPAPPRPVRIPKPQETTLPNGLRVIVAEDRDMPLISARVVIASGAEVDPAGASGLADLTAELLTKGTDSRSAPEIAHAVESLGGELESGATWDSSNIDVNVMSSKFEPALGIVADVVRRPTFSEEEVERLRQQFLDNIRIELRDPASVAGYVAARTVFEGGQYGHPLSGTPESIERIRRDDVVALHRRCYLPDNTILVIGGDIEAAHAFELARRHFGDWERPASSAPAPARPADETSLAARKVVVIDMEEAGQAAVVVARPGIRRSDPGYFTGLVANSVLGGGYSARLNQEIRIRRGLSYGAGSSLEARRGVGPFTAATQTKNESAVEVASLILEEMQRLATEPVSQEELTPRKAVLTGNFGRSLETTSGLVSRIASLALYGMPLEGINSYIESVQAVTPEQVRKFTSSELNPAGASVIIVGNARLFAGHLHKSFKHAEVIPLAKLNLN
jgi:zinc protease